MSLGKTFARRLRWHRSRQGKSQAVIAGLAGLNPEYVGQIERENRTPSLDTVEALATALAVPVAQLLTGAEEPARVPTEAQLASDLHHALHTSSTDRDQQGLRLSDLRERVDHAWNVWQGAPNRYSRIFPLIAPLIREVTQYCSQSTGSDDQRLAADAYGLLRTVARRTNHKELALLAADRGNRAAERSCDPVRLATARWNSSHALLALGEHSAAKEVALDAISQVASTTNRGAGAITGALWLTAAVAQARSGNKFTALEWINDRASPLAEKTGETNVGRTCFGPSNVALHAVSIELEDGQAASALTLADRFDTSSLASRERHTTWSLDLARGHILRFDPGAAMLYLLQAETTGAEDLRYNSDAHDTLRRVLHRARPSIRTQAVGLTRRLGIEEVILAG